MSIFKSSSIAGKIGEEVAPETLAKVGRAVAAGLLRGSGTVVVGHDGSGGSDGLAKALAEGVAAGGCVVADVGAAPRCAADFAGRLLRAKAGLYVRLGDGEEQREVQLFFDRIPAAPVLLRALQQAFEANEWPQADGGEVEDWREDIAEEYVQWLANSGILAASKGKVRAAVMAPAGFLADAAARMGEAFSGLVLEVVEAEKPLRLPRGGGPAPELSKLGAKVRESGAAFGALLDASGIFARFVDDKGRPLSPDEMGCFLLGRMADECKGQKVVLDARMNQPLADLVKKSGGTAVFAPVGEPGLMERFKECAALLALGADGTAVFRTAAGPDALHSVLRVAKMLQGDEAPLSKRRKEMALPEVLGDVVVPCRQEWYHPILSRIRSAYPRERQAEVEGVRVRMDDGWALAALLPDEGAILYRFGGKDKEAVERIAVEVLDSAVELRGSSRRLAGLPERPVREDDYYDDYVN